MIVGCSEEATETSRQEIVNSSTTDTRFPQVGGFHVEYDDVDHRCSAVVVAHDIAVTAGHCLGPRLQQSIATVFSPCQTFQRDPRAFFQTKIQLNASGDGASPFTDYIVDAVNAPPGAFYRDPRTCSPSQPGSCDNFEKQYGAGGTAGFHQNGADIAILHFITKGRPSLASIGVRPMRVVTDDKDPAYWTFNSHPYAVHVNLDLATVYQNPSPATIPYARIAGWGNNTAGPDGGSDSNRHSAIVQIHTGAGWPLFPSQSRVFNCDGSWMGFPPDRTALRLDRTSVGNFGYYASGDSGGAVVVSGDGSYTAPGIPKGDYLLGVITGLVDVSTYPMESALLGGQSYQVDGNNNVTRWSLGKWLEEHLLDFDGDGVLDADDNCVVAWNPDQANSNYQAEVSYNLRNGYTPGSPYYAPPLGDACDPVPCPYANAERSSVETGPLGGQPSCNGGQCTGRRIKDEIDLNPVGASKQHTATTAPNQAQDVAVTVNNSQPRFCQNNFQLFYNCLDPLVVQDNRLQSDKTDLSELNTPAQPYHRVTVAPGRCTNPTQYGCASYIYPTNLVRGESLASYSYSTASQYGIKWDYATDLAFWTANSKIPAPNATVYPECVQPWTYGAGTCLDGQFWTNGDTPVGLTVASTSGVFVDLHAPGATIEPGRGLEFSNHYFPLRPDSAEIWRTTLDLTTYAPYPLFSVDFPRPYNVRPPWTYYQGARAYPVTSTGGTTYAVTDNGTESPANAFVGPVLGANLQSYGWVNAIEPVPRDPSALGLAADGVTIERVTRKRSGKLVAGNDLMLKATRTYTPAASVDYDANWGVAAKLGLPVAIGVRDGNAGNGTATLTYWLASGASNTCTYTGGSSRAHPNTPAEAFKGRHYVFTSCTSGAVPGQVLLVTRIALHLDDGDSFAGPTTATVRIPTSEHGSSFTVPAPAPPGGALPPSRTNALPVYASVPQLVFVVGGQSTTQLHDVWVRPLWSQWKQIASSLGTPRAATYSFVDQRLWVLDQAATSLSVLRMDIDGNAETVAIWPLSAQYDKFWMAIDPDGRPLLIGSSSSTNMHRVVRFKIGATIGAEAIGATSPAQARAPYVDTRGIVFFDAIVGDGLTTRRPYLPLGYAAIELSTTPFP